ncbi:hypothetical protein Taro_044859, partial [Colocasia esculenta]|nr:hypothetical protein [Colocasia esculenta]
VVVCIRAACRTLGGHANVDSGKVMASYIAFRLRRRATSRSQPLCIFKEVRPNRAAVRSVQPGKELLWFLGAIRGSGGVLGVLSLRGRRVEWGRRRIMLGLSVLRKEFGGPVPISECLFSWVPQVLCEPGTCVCSGLVPVLGIVEIFYHKESYYWPFWYINKLT